MTRGAVLSAGAKRSKRARGYRSLLLCCAAVWLGPSASVLGAANEPLVSIEGGVAEDDPSAHIYAWTITNHYTSPIMRVEIPHYRADTFTAPKGWKTKCTYLVGIGVPDKPGECTATADAPGTALVRGASAEFRMRIAGGGTTPQRGRGKVLVGFADGKEVVIDGVEVPQAPATSTKYIPLIGLALIFVAAVAIREWRRRKARPATDS